jgi:histidyl-tRNA synthetase
MLIDQLRQLGIPTLHDLANDSLSAQLRDAEQRGIPYAVIIGQKEFVEDSFILRDLNARNQEFIDQPTLLRKLKRTTSI